MSKILYIGFIIILFSCKSNHGIAQEKENNNQDKTPIEKPKFGDPNDNDLTKLNANTNDQIPPNTIHLHVVVQNIMDNKSICNFSGTTGIKVKVTEIKGSGSGIVNMPSLHQELILVWRKGSGKDLIATQEKSNKEFFIIAREKPCTNFSQTMFEIVNFKLLD